MRCRRGIGLTIGIAIMIMTLLTILIVAWLLYVKTRLTYYTYLQDNFIIGLAWSCMSGNTTPIFAEKCIRDNIVKNIPILEVECNCTFKRIVEKVYEWTITEPYRECTCKMGKNRMRIILYLYLTDLYYGETNNRTLLDFTLVTTRLPLRVTVHACGIETPAVCVYYTTRSMFLHVENCSIYLPCTPKRVEICTDYGNCIEAWR
ncbi:MAG: hypothetical protein GXO26_04560 [Crenarchaeota archaeon]|nr:hypothetical protein [Thermoproteota archaeon]